MGFEVPTESRVEVLDDPDLPFGSGIRGDPKDLGGTLVLVPNTKGACLIRVLVRVRSWGLGFEVGGPFGSGWRENDPFVVDFVSPEFWVSS